MSAKHVWLSLKRSVFSIKLKTVVVFRGDGLVWKIEEATLHRKLSYLPHDYDSAFTKKRRRLMR